MRIKSTEVVDTFAEAFKMWGARVVITAANKQWAMAAAQSMTGFATSIIGCKCEAGIEKLLSPEQTPDGRPGVSALLFTMDRESAGKRLRGARRPMRDDLPHHLLFRRLGGARR